MVSSEVFITYMIATTICIIILFSYIIRLIKMNNNIRNLIYVVDKKHTTKENVIKYGRE